jgi:hypothetical protein
VVKARPGALLSRSTRQLRKLRKSPNGFWQQRANRRRYLDWLGQQLGFQQPEDWTRLRVADVLHHRGKGLLKRYQFRIEPLVREYLGY